MALRCFKRLLRSSSDTSLKRWPCVRWGDPSDGVRLDFGNTKGKDINQISNILIIHMRIHKKLRESGEYRKPIHKRSIPQTNKQKRNNLQQWKNRVFLLDTTKGKQNKEIKQNVVTVFCYFCWTVTFPEMIAWQYGSAVSSSSVSVISSWWASTLSLMDSKLEPLTPVSWLRLRPRQYEQDI